MKRLLVVVLITLLFSAGCSMQSIVYWAWTTEGGSPASASQALRVAQCESGFNPFARSPSGNHWGIFQMHFTHADSLLPGQPRTALFDPVWNTRAAKHLYDGSGWGPWSCKP